jgi:endonuclease-3
MSEKSSGRMKRRRSGNGPVESQRVRKVADLLDGCFGRRRRASGTDDPMETLVGTLLSQNTNDRNSYRAWQSLRKRFPTWDDVAASSWRSVATAIKVGGLKNQKARRIKEILKRVKADAGGYSLDFLREKSNKEAMEYLLSMKGVGKKTAACVLVFSLKRDLFPVDTHIHRLCNRLGFVKTKSAEETFDVMEPLVPAGRAYSFHVNLIQFGREVCKAQQPLCGECVLFDECAFPRKLAFAQTSHKPVSGSKSRGNFFVTEHLRKPQLS